MNAQIINMKHDPLGDGLSRLELIDWMGTDQSIVRAARVSYQGDTAERFAPKDRWNEITDVLNSEKDEKLLRYLLQHGHTSPLEHTAVTFHVKCPLFIRSQWHRHRMASYNEVSRRYTSEEIEFYYPHTWRMQDTVNKQGSIDSMHEQTMLEDRLIKTVMLAFETYEMMIEDGVAREQARMVLPQNLYTRFYYTANLHSILHFYRLRADEHAQPEIQVYAKAIGAIMSQLFPVTWYNAMEVYNG